MADRQQVTQRGEPDPELKKIPEASQTIPVSEEELREQRRSFAFGLCKRQYDVAELNVEPPSSAGNAAPGVERQDQPPEANGKQNGTASQRSSPERRTSESTSSTNR
jgi:hypothetical protein